MKQQKVGRIAGFVLLLSMFIAPARAQLFEHYTLTLPAQPNGTWQNVNSNYGTNCQPPWPQVPPQAHLMSQYVRGHYTYQGYIYTVSSQLHYCAILGGPGLQPSTCGPGGEGSLHLRPYTPNGAFYSDANHSRNFSTAQPPCQNYGGAYCPRPAGRLCMEGLLFSIGGNTGTNKTLIKGAYHVSVSGGPNQDARDALEVILADADANFLDSASLVAAAPMNLSGGGATATWGIGYKGSNGAGNAPCTVSWCWRYN